MKHLLTIFSLSLSLVGYSQRTSQAAFFGMMGATSSQTVDLSFTGTGITNTGTVWTAATKDGTFNHLGVATVKLSSGQTGRVIMHMPSGVYTEFFFMLRTTQTTGTQVDAVSKVAFYFDQNGFIQKYSNGASDGVQQQTSFPLYLAIYRDGASGVLKLQRSVDMVNWTDLYTYSTTYTGDLWPAFRLWGNATYGNVKDPKLQIL